MKYRLSDPDIAVSEGLARWLVDQVGRPHPKLRREGPICPFVIPALRAGSLSVSEHRWRGPCDLARMVGLIDVILGRFLRTPPCRRDHLTTSVVVVTGLPESAWHLVDEAHRRVDLDVLAHGCMLGRYHPKCVEPSVRNPCFPVHRAPYPLFTIRRMSLHDIVFLHQDPVRFEGYRQLLADRFGASAPLTPVLRDLYTSTCRRYGVDERISDLLGRDSVVCRDDIGLPTT